MKGRKPTREQKKILEKKGLNPYDWLVLKNPTDSLVVQHKEKGSIETIKLGE